MICEMKKRVQWGVLGTAEIALEYVIPAMQRGEWSDVAAIGSRDLKKARTIAQRLGIPKAYGSYEALLADEEIEAVYIPLPNHLHVPWSIKAAEAGKHVLCEKPIGLTAGAVRKLLAVRDRTGVKVEESFMVRTHPQWLGALEVINSGRIGEVRSVMGFLGYFNRDSGNIRNIPDYGGGALLDIGCYLITISRFIFGEEPQKVIGLVENDPEFKIDRLVSAILDFPSGHSIFSCSTQLSFFQRVHIVGTKGQIEIEIPFSAPNDQPCRILIKDGSDVRGGHVEVSEFRICDQYTIEADLFAKAIREDSEVAVPLEDSIKNLAVIDALFRSAKTGEWEAP